MNYVTYEKRLQLMENIPDSFEFQLLNINEEPIDLTGASVTANVLNVDKKVYQMTPTITDSTQGKVSLNFEGEFVPKKRGTIKFEIRVVYSNGRIETFPVDGYVKISVIRQIKS